MTTITNYEDLNNTIQKDFVLVIAKTKTCTICKTIDWQFKHQIKHYESLEKFEVYIEDVERFRGEHMVFSVPTILFFSEGKELLRQSRFFNFDMINRLIETYRPLKNTL